jgi:hypothetical protein
MMTPYEQRTLQGLDDHVTCYRGVRDEDDPDLDLGFSWTLKLKLALWYTVTLDDLEEKESLSRVAVGVLPRSEIIAAFEMPDSRGDYELIIRPEGVHERSWYRGGLP